MTGPFLCTDEILARPLHAFPSLDKHEAAYVFVQKECHPHRDKSKSEMNAEKPASEYRDGPHNYDSECYREIDVPGTAKGIDCEHIYCPADFQYHVHEQNNGAGPDYPRIRSQERQYGFSGAGRYQ